MHPIRSCIDLLRFILGHITDYFKGRNRVFVCFIGPDGSGKSTISSLVMEAMQDIFDDRKYYHGHFGILPPLSDFFFPSNKKEIKPEEKPITDTPKTVGKIPAAVMIFYYSMEFLLGFFLIKIQRRKYDLVVFDRYYYDYAIQPPFTKDSFFFKALLIGIPKPDIIVFLKSPAEIIYHRKPELSIQEISRQIEICDYFMTKVHNPCIVDNTQPKDLVVQTIRSKILEILRDRAWEKHVG